MMSVRFEESAIDTRSRDADAVHPEPAIRASFIRERLLDGDVPWLAVLVAPARAQLAAYLHDIIREAVRLEPKDLIDHYNLGIIFTKTGDLDAAIAALRTALQLDPKDSVMHVALGNALEAKADYNSALNEYRLAVELDPTSTMAKSNLDSLSSQVKK